MRNALFWGTLLADAIHLADVILYKMVFGNWNFALLLPLSREHVQIFAPTHDLTKFWPHFRQNLFTISAKLVSSKMASAKKYVEQVNWPP